MDIKERILVALGLNKDEEIKLGWQSKSEDGGTIFVSTAEELENGVDVSVLLEDGTTVLLPIGTYRTDTGVSFRVEEEGIVGEVIESETEEEVTEDEEVDAREEKEEYSEMAEAVEFKFPESEAEKADWAKSYEEMKDKVDNLMDAIADIKKQIGETGDVEEMSEELAEPSTNPKSIKTVETIEFSAEEELENLKAENEKLKTELAASPADAPINTNKFSAERPALSRKEYKKLSSRDRFLHDLNK